MRLQVIALSVFMLTASCHKSEPEPFVPGMPVSSFSAMVDGKIFMSSDISATVAGTTLSINATQNAGTGKQSQLGVFIPHYAGLTDYPIDTATTAHYAEPGGAIYIATGGTITIATDNATHITGSFSFNATESGRTATKSVTDGHFDVYK